MSSIKTKISRVGIGSLNAFRRARNRNQLDECLHSLPRDLDGTYERILCNIDEIYIEDVRRILTVLCLSIRPLTIDELIHAYTVELGESPYLDSEGRSYEDCGSRESKRADYIDRSYCAFLCPRVSSIRPHTIAEGRKIRDLEGAALRVPSCSLRCHTSVPLLRKDVAHSFLTWVKLHDIDRRWNTGIWFERGVDDIPSPIYYAALLGLESTLKSILAVCERDMNPLDTVNRQCGVYSNALQAASVRGHKEVVQVLLDRGADVNAQGGFYGNVLQAASYQGHREVGGEHCSALQAASATGRNEVVQMLLGRGARLDAE
ncbi:hypothetical protein N7471_010329 [Penicillium samsonianum]|uniref:uncharacterized protein n=1 Tax=Penicillium samsonianum TaxID=1882272 RepID=UPI002546805F|nr:uncharacterized protein N7471_010329 [Penicillium samsonianum]KAJ6125836.1 hypothetical protein N7471_010329 [Penicillium samsonianum]